MKESLPKRSKSKKNDPRQALREARKAAQPVFELGEAELAFVGPDGSEYYRLKPISIPGYTYAF